MKNSRIKLETDLNTLRSLIAVVEEGGFSAAAKKVHRTQSAVSVQIAKLEEQLNTKLLERTSRSVQLTQAGETFLSYARRILELSDEATFAVSPWDHKDELRVGFAEYLAPQHLQSVVSGFREQHPSCDLSLVLGLGGPLLEMLEKGQIDLVIAGPEGNNGEVLWEEQLVWTGTCDAPDDSTVPMKLITMPPPCLYRKLAYDSLTKISRPWKLSIEANSFEAVQSAIRAGLGVTVLPETAIREDMTVIEELPDLPKTTVNSYMSPAGTHAFAQPFIDYLVYSAGKETISA
ncbi:LysR family transcriptional regulator [Pontiellaceae bacterium B12227]|nr:LysR family transcriptional regulator [Pontiellaceae bacterium B12227]